MNTALNPPKRERPFLLFSVLLLLGTAIIFARNPIALFHPSMFAEDGVWTSVVYRHGSLASYWMARLDYLVVGNMMLINLAVAANHAIIGADDITRLPEAIAVVSYVFFAAVAALPVVALRSYMSLSARLLLWFLLLLIPVGSSAKEIFGFVVNVGFSFAFIAVMIVLWRESFAVRPWRTDLLALDVVLLVCCATNPIVIGIAGAYLLFRFGVFRGRSINDWLLAAVLLPIAIVDAIGILTVPNDQAGGVITASGLVYTALARPLLYPLLFPWYDQLNHALTLILSALLIALFVLGWRETPHKRGLGFVLFSAALTTLAIAIQRPNYVQHLSDYATSYPDRYYLAQNLFVLTAIVWAAEAFMRSGALRLKAAGSAMVAGLMLMYALNPERIFDFHALRNMTPAEPAFAQQLRMGRTLQNDPDVMEVDIFPPGWSARYPARFRPEVEASPHKSS